MPNMKSLFQPVTKTGKAMHKVENAVVLGS